MVNMCLSSCGRTWEVTYNTQLTHANHEPFNNNIYIIVKLTTAVLPRTSIARAIGLHLGIYGI